MKTLISIFVCALVACAALAAYSIEIEFKTDAEPVFSFWGNLTIGDQARIEGLTFQEDLVPLPEDKAFTCCIVQPGQPLTLIRNGVIAGTGSVGSIIAGSVRRAGDDRLVVFQAEGLLDSIVVPDWPVNIKYSNRSYDLYVIGDMSVRIIEPKRAVWDKSRGEDMDIILKETLDQKIVFPVEFDRRFTVTDDRMMPRLVLSGEVSEWMLKELNVFSFELDVELNKRIEVLVCERGAQPNSPCFVGIDTCLKNGYYYLRGELDLVLDVNGKLYLVMRSSVSETGMWGYSVYLILPDGTPKLVHSDASWST